MSPRARRFFGCVLPLAFLVAGCGAFLMLGYAGQVAITVDPVRDAAMAPLLAPGVTVLVNNMAFWIEEPYRPAVVSVGRPGGRRIRRIVGLPGETVAIRDNAVLADGRPAYRLPAGQLFPDFGPLTLGEGEYFLLADTPDGEDSRQWGPIRRDDIFGVATFYRGRDSASWQVVETPVPRPTRGRR